MMTTSTSTIKYKVKVVDYTTIVWAQEYDTQPSFETIVESLIADHGS